MVAVYGIKESSTLSHGTKTSLVLGGLTDLRLVLTFEPFPTSQEKERTESGNRGATPLKAEIT